MIQNEKINAEILKISDNAKFKKHILTNEHITEMTMIEKRYPIMRLPVCGHCEKPALWSKTNGERTATCMICGTITKNPIKLSEYLIQGHDLPLSMSSEKKEEIKAKRAVSLEE